MSLAGALVAGFSFLLGLWYVVQKLAGFGLTPGLPTTVLVVSSSPACSSSRWGSSGNTSGGSTTR